MTQVVNQNQVQAQQQQQQQAMFDRFERLIGSVVGNQFMRARQNQDLVNLGTLGETYNAIYAKRQERLPS